MMQTIRNIATDVIAVIAGAAIYIVVMLIMLLACAYYKLRGDQF